MTDSGRAHNASRLDLLILADEIESANSELERDRLLSLLREAVVALLRRS
jgi:hypothetical protein